jgi:hypothetical protein
MPRYSRPDNGYPARDPSPSPSLASVTSLSFRWHDRPGSADLQGELYGEARAYGSRPEKP